ncbi:glycosyltransferase family 4 protein [Shimia sediminis]|uniref:glycosyltransferase family 4 protein n=1 Tax=Shimia sediminis TaxID=2497945 RepID=UPI000F8EE4A5|nr:glycosyltransferase family 1 protein [Shimia sediminis]
MNTETRSHPPAARLLELTRVVSLHGRRPSGVDRVCLAYLWALCRDPVPVYGLYRSSLGYVLLDQVGVKALLQRLDGAVPWGAPDWVSRLRRKASTHSQVVEAECRRLRLARCRPSGLERLLRRHLPEGTTYVNVDQTNLSARVLKAVKALPGGRVAVFLHDTIPLDFPDLQTPSARLKLTKILGRVQAYADLILTNSRVSAEDIHRHIEPLGAVPRIEAVHLGVEPVFFQIRDNPAPPEVAKPYFLMLGTIEPRKQHGMILDIWERLAEEIPEADMPHLVICGRRGWMGEALFPRLDQSPLKGRFLHEFNDLADDALRALTAHCCASLFPSRAEGFGLPPAEAAAVGVPVLCSDLPVFREILGDIPIYVGVSDSYAWKTAIIDLTRQEQARGKGTPRTRMQYSPPTWEAHFNTVLKLV